MDLITDRYGQIVASIETANVQDVYQAFRTCAFNKASARHLESRQVSNDGAGGYVYDKAGPMKLVGLIWLSKLGDDNASNNRKIRRIIEILRKAGVCILSDKTGYWLSVDRPEIREFAAGLRQRAASIIESAKQLEAVLVSPARIDPNTSITISDIDGDGNISQETLHL